VLVLDMIEILPPLGKYKYDTWRILPVKCYIDNSVRLWSCIRNVNKHLWRRCRGGSQYLLSVYILHGIILTSIISLTDLSAALWLFVVVTGMCFVEPKSPTVHHSFLRFTLRFISTGLLGFLIRQVSKKSNQRDMRMSFKQRADETFAEAWEHYHDLMIDLPTVGMEDWEFT
jgi:cell division protein FtsW (lipid II flippase)